MGEWDDPGGPDPHGFELDPACPEGEALDAPIAPAQLDMVKRLLNKRWALLKEGTAPAELVTACPHPLLGPSGGSMLPKQAFHLINKEYSVLDFERLLCRHLPGGKLPCPAGRRLHRSGTSG